MANKVAVVTGSNKGIGFSIVRALCRRGVAVVYLTARDETRGKEAVAKLEEEGLNPKFYQLEVTNRDSVKAFADFLKKTHGGLDILVNNAAIINTSFQETTYEDSKRVIETNFDSLLIIQEYLFPVLKDNARVVNVASDCGHISNLENKYWIERLTKPDIKLEDVNAFVSWFLDSVKNGSLDKSDFQSSELLAYKVSKIAMCALTRAQQNEIDRNISINSIHPGFVKTDMTKNFGQLTADESAESVVHLALDVDQSVRGRYYWFDKTEKVWDDHNSKIHVNREELKRYMDEIGFWNK